MKNMTSRKFLAGFAVASLLVFGACGSDPEETEQTTGTVTPATPSESADPDQNSDGVPGQTARTAAAQQAVVTAAEHLDGIAYEIDDDDDRWDVDVYADGKSFDVELDSSGTDVIRDEQDDSVSTRVRDLLSDVQVSLADAIATAAAEVGGDLDDAEFETRGGQPVWSVSMKNQGDEFDVTIDANTGEVLDVERD